MPIETLAATPGVGWTTTVGASRAVAVALPDDGDTSYLEGTGLQVTTSAIANTAIAGATITNVRVVARLRTTTISDTCIIAASDNSFSNTTSYSPTVTSSYVDYTMDMATPPSGGAWTTGKVDSLEVRVTTPDITTARMTTLYVQVTYMQATVSRAASMIFGTSDLL